MKPYGRRAIGVRIEPAEATLGAVVTGVALTGDLDDDSFAEIMAAWHRHGVLVFPEQHLDDDAQAAFTRRIGPLENVAIFRDKGRDAYAVERKHIAAISNRRSDGSVAKKGSAHALLLKGNTYWHTDSSFKRVPAKASLLSARQVPSEGGETEWADMRAAWDALDSEMQARLEGKVAVHSYAYSQGLVGGTDLVRDISLLPPVEHALVPTHPISGRKSLFIGRHASHIVGEDVTESRALLARLCEDACQPPRLWKHHWRNGDAVLWDNRCVLHRGYSWPDGEVRDMVRTTVAGDAPGNEWLYDTEVAANTAT